MTASPAMPDEIQALRDRVRFLEEALEENAYTMDVLASTTAIFGDADKNRSPEHIVQTSLEAVRRLLPARDMAVYLLDSDASFNLAHHDKPAPNDSDLVEAVEDLIREGTFSWALHQNHPVCLPAQLGPDGVLLHVISTRTRIRGMFAARLTREDCNRKETRMAALTMVLFNTAYALESADLFQVMERRQKALQRITERQSREVLHHMSHDSLTGLPNRMLLSDRLKQAIERNAESGRHVAMILLDLDNFKRLNDTLGHRAGDDLIRMLATDLSRLLEGVQDRDGRLLRATLSRLGGDEFGILLEDLEGLEVCVRLVTEIVRTTAVERTVLGQPVVTSVSCGIALYPEDGEDCDTLLGNADAAMYEAKQRGRNGFRFYTRNVSSRTFHHFQLENELGHAIEDNQLVLHYQPKVDIRSGAIVGAEALVRWQHPALGLLPPSHFMDLAEDMTLIEDIGKWVLRRVCGDLEMLEHTSERLPQIAVNVSARQLRQPDLSEALFEITEAAGIPPDRIELELTETAIIDDFEASARMFRRLQTVGMSLAIDDFGTGHASLIQLKQVPADRLKIDRSFVQDLDQVDADPRLVQAIVQMARTLGLGVIAEGVETPTQAARLVELGCDQAQGFLYAHPMPFAEFLEMIRADVRLPQQAAPGARPEPGAHA